MTTKTLNAVSPAANLAAAAQLAQQKVDRALNNASRLAPAAQETDLYVGKVAGNPRGSHRVAIEDGELIVEGSSRWNPTCWPTVTLSCGTWTLSMPTQTTKALL